MYSFRGFCGGPPAMFCAWKRSTINKKHGGGIPTKPTKALQVLTSLCIGIAIKSKMPPERPPTPHVN